jgi:hypothetical protein
MKNERLTPKTKAMKKVKLFSVLSLALILFSATGYAKQPAQKKASGTAVSVRHIVNVNLNTDKPICNTYQVELLDASGRAVAPAQYFVPGKKSYTFYEQTRQAAGLRIARLVLAPNIDRFACQLELFTAPDVKLINFVDRETYNFNLNPNAKPSKMIE